MQIISDRQFQYTTSHNELYVFVEVSFNECFVIRVFILIIYDDTVNSYLNIEVSITEWTRVLSLYLNGGKC